LSTKKQQYRKLQSIVSVKFGLLFAIKAKPHDNKTERYFS